jgi:AcrR family transcriptional regulator
MTFEPLTPERRRAMTRQHLLDAAAVVFARDGFHVATLDEVAAAAGFSKGAVYSNFKNKEDLFLALFDERIDRQFAVVSEALDSGSQDVEQQFSRIRQVVRMSTWDNDFVTLWLEFVLYARRNPEIQEKLVASARRLRAHVQGLIDHEYDTAGVVPKIPTDDLAQIGLAVFDGLGLARLIDPAAANERTMENTLAFLFDAMSVERADEHGGDRSG